MTKDELFNIAEKVAYNFKTEQKIEVSLRAIGVLVNQAYIHIDNINRGLSDGRLTISDIEKGLYNQLEEALELANIYGKDNIGEDTTRVSFERKCHYSF
jgi:hypothetical protein